MFLPNLKAYPSAWLNFNFRASECRMKLASILPSAAENHVNKFQTSILHQPFHFAESRQDIALAHIGRCVFFMILIIVVQGVKARIFL